MHSIVVYSPENQIKCIFIFRLKHFSWRCTRKITKKSIVIAFHSVLMYFKMQLINFCSWFCFSLLYLLRSDGAENSSKWNEFVDSIKSKLTVKQVVDGVRAGGQLSFDYLALIVTAEWVKIGENFYHLNIECILLLLNAQLLGCTGTNRE